MKKLLQQSSLSSLSSSSKCMLLTWRHFFVTLVVTYVAIMSGDSSIVMNAFVYQPLFVPFNNNNYYYYSSYHDYHENGSIRRKGRKNGGANKRNNDSLWSSSRRRRRTLHFTNSTGSSNNNHNHNNNNNNDFFSNRKSLLEMMNNNEHPSDMSSAAMSGGGGGNKINNISPFPTMPSMTFLSLVESQFELLATGLMHNNDNKVKVKSMALYLPQENPRTGQLEFLPAAVYPSPNTERVFIASDAGSGLAPNLPELTKKLVGFTHAQSLIPTYPFFTPPHPISSSSSSSSSTGATTAVEEVYDKEEGQILLSAPLFSGSRNNGVLLLWPATAETTTTTTTENKNTNNNGWTEGDKQQVSLAANSLALALSMDQERSISQAYTQEYAVALADNMHQLKNPLQAMRTFAKLMQRQVVMDQNSNNNNNNNNNYHNQTRMNDYSSKINNSTNNTIMSSSMPSYTDIKKKKKNHPPQLLALAENMMLQSERVLDLLEPMDSIVNSMDQLQRQQTKTKTTPFLLPSQQQQNDDLAIIPSTQNNNNNNGVTSFFTQTTTNNDIDSSSQLFIPSRKRRTNYNTNNNTPTKSNRNIDNHVNDLIPPPKEESSHHYKSSSSSSHLLLKYPMNLEMTFIQDLLEPIVSSFQVLASESNIRLEVYGLENDELPGVTVCPKALQEALSNVLDNAIKYAPLSSSSVPCIIQIVITHNIEPLQPGITIYIRDNGPGIPIKERDAVFQRGYRGETTKSLSPGSGIGLDISSELMKRMGGSLNIFDDTDDIISQYIGNNEGFTDDNGGTTMQFIIFRHI